MVKKLFFSLLCGLFLLGCQNISSPRYWEYSAVFTGERTELYHQQEKWDFQRFLEVELTNNPDMECNDLVIFCCQAAFGIEVAGEGNQERFNKKFAAVKPDSDLELIKVISPDTARVNLAAWKAAGLPALWLFRMGVMESEFSDSQQKMKEYISIAAKAVAARKMTFTAKEFIDAAENHQKSGHKHLKHSINYRKNNPPYVLISTRCTGAVPVLKAAAKIASPQTNTPRIIAIDGRAASGKTTLAGQLKIILDAQLIHMDDFFLPPAMRTKMRFEEPGGNVHYERFKEEVLGNLKKSAAFSYRIFDCKKLIFNGNRMIWAKSPWRIVEGAYSHHPQFGKYADLKVFYDIDPAEQMRRIEKRNGAQAARMFKNRWIPFEEKYIKTFSIDKEADLVIK